MPVWFVPAVYSIGQNSCSSTDTKFTLECIVPIFLCRSGERFLLELEVLVDPPRLAWTHRGSPRFLVGLNLCSPGAGMDYATRSSRFHTRTFLPRARNTGAAISWRHTIARTFSGKGSAASLWRRASFAAKSRAISGFKASIGSTFFRERGAG